MTNSHRPSGLATAIAAKRFGLDYIVIEQGSLVDAIARFPTNMVFFTTPELLEIGGIPLAVFGAVAYFVAFSLAILAAYGNRLMWKLFGIQTALMAAVSLYLVYLQAFVISSSRVPFVERFCQFCLLSAATSVTLFIIALVSRFWRG